MLSSYAVIHQSIVNQSFPTAEPKTLKRLIKVVLAGYVGLVLGCCALVGGAVAGTYQLASMALPTSSH